MNKEQFKKSILNLINYYTSSLIQLNLQASGKEDEIVMMAENQAKGLSQAFYHNIDTLVDKIEWPQEVEEDE